MSRVIKGLKQAAKYAKGDTTAGRSTMVKVPQELRAADYLGAKNDPVGPTSGPAVPGKSRRLKRNPQS
jgi:hypothetical protein